MVQSRAQRPSRRSMTPEEVAAYLDQAAEWAVLTTIGRDGYPHSVAIGYFRQGDALYLGMRDATQKVKNAERNPKVSVQVADARGRGGVRGVLIQGEASIVRDDGERLALARAAARWRGVSESEWPSNVAPDGCFLRVVPRKTISWVPA